VTAQIAIMNKEAIALASDSAVTITGGKKIFTSANKLFALSKYHPVGIMVFGNAVLMEVPWETIVKTYRSRLGTKRFDTLGQYVADFIAFLDNGNSLFSETVQDVYVRNSIYGYFAFVRDKIAEAVHAKIDQEGETSDSEIRQIVGRAIADDYDRCQRAEKVPSLPETYEQDIASKYGHLISEAMGEIFEQLPLGKRQVSQLKSIAAALFSRFPEGLEAQTASGVVVAGFGKADIFPSLQTLDVDGVSLNRLKHRVNERMSSKIDFETGAVITPFAQRDMVVTFMEGIDPFLEASLNAYMSEIFGRYPDIVADSVTMLDDQGRRALRSRLRRVSRRILKDYHTAFEDYKREKYTGPVLDVVEVLPKDELAAMAEALVNLTSFKRKVTMESETVGGPIDVAVISKGDGFIWIKRKHYFKPELNPQFFANYYKEDWNG